MKVCHITSVHIPFDTRIFYKECRSLVRAGYEVHLVARHDSDEVIDGIMIHGFRPRKSKLMRMLFSTRDVYRKAVDIDADLYHFHDPELMPFGLLLKLRGKRVICDVHEDYPDYIAYKDTIPWILRKPAAVITGLIERLSARFYDAVVTVTPKLYNRFKRYNDRTLEVRNFPFLDELAPGGKAWEERQDAVMYVGSLTLDRGIEEMIRAVAIARRKRSVKFILGGAFPSSAVKNHLTDMPEFRDVDYRGFMSREEIAAALADVKAGIVFTHANTNHMNAYMTKLFEYMAAGIPTIASDYPLWRKIVDGAGCGVLVEPVNVEALADAIIAVLENPEEAQEMGRRGRKAIEERYNWENEEQVLLGVYGEVLGKIPGK